MRVNAAGAVSVAIVLAIFGVVGQAQQPAAQPPAVTSPDAALVAPELDTPCSSLRRDTSMGQKAYTAQEKPRIAVREFVNTNEAAVRQGFGSSVSAMLVTFLKRKSQFVVVERDQDTLKNLEDELGRIGAGVTDKSSAQTLKLDAFDALLQGQVTLIGEGAATRIEVDARLLGMDGRILSVSSKFGLVSDLRSVVERLGVDLEQGFLRPYYGSLTVTIPEPSNVRVFLTPILSECARADEKPPTELRGFVPEGENAKYRRWRTQPNVVTITNLLGGWYTLRFERPGYDGLGPNSAENAQLEIVSDYGEPKPKVRSPGGAHADPKSEQSRYIVQVKPLATETWVLGGADALDARNSLRKRAGSVRLLVKREFIDLDYVNAADIPDLMTVLKSEALAINDDSDLVSDGDDEAIRNVTRTPPASCGPYAFEQVKHGDVVVRDYHTLAPERRDLPVGKYTAYVSLPQYVVSQVPVDVQNRVADQVVRVDLKRGVGAVRIERVGDARADYHVVFEGRQTKIRRPVPLDFTPASGFEVRDLPLDAYNVYNDLPGFKNWRATLTLLHPPAVEPLKLAERECAVVAAELPPLVEPRGPGSVYLIKAQPWLAGRVASGMRSYADNNLRERPRATALLDAAITEEERDTRRNDPRGQGANEPSLLVSPVSREVSSSEDVFAMLRSTLEGVDLLYLTDADTKRLAALPKTAGIIREFIEAGGSVFALVSVPADYSGLFGAAIPFGKAVERGEIEIRPGSEKGLQLDVRIGLQVKRSFPTVQADKKQPLSGWRVLAYRKKGAKEPAILERGEPGAGGYALVWVDALENLDHPTAREALAAAEKRAIAWSQHHMFRRFGPDSAEARTATDRMNSLVFTVRREVKKGM
jgi:curli biogenesis system outer membrane secretion channel CsgG